MARSKFKLIRLNIDKSFSDGSFVASDFHEVQIAKSRKLIGASYRLIDRKQITIVEQLKMTGEQLRRSWQQAMKVKERLGSDWEVIEKF
jgi:hypothetical protein